MKNVAKAVVKSRDLLEEKTDDLPKDIQMVPLSFFSFFLFLITFSLLQDISKDVSKRNQPQRVGTLNQSRLNKYIVSGTLLNKIIRILFKMKFPTIQAIGATSAVTSRW